MARGQSFDLRFAETDEEVARCFALMRQLRPNLGSAAEFVERWARQKDAGYRLLVLWEGARPLALAGFRVQENLIFGPHLYVDDLVTDAAVRGGGLGRLVLNRLKAEGEASGLDLLVLDTPLTNALGHRFYFREGLLARALKFSCPLAAEPERAKG